MWKKIVYWGFGGLGFMSQISYQNATSNLSSWIPEFITPNWLKNTNIDNWVLSISISIIVMVFVWSHKNYILTFFKGLKTDNKNLVSNKIERIPLIGLFKEAEKQGWNFTRNNAGNIIKFCDLLRQAGVDSEIILWGRKKESSNDMSVRNPLIKIPSNYWKLYNLDISTLFIMELCRSKTSEIENANLGAITYDPNLKDIIPTHLDIHLDKKQALKWLKSQRK